MQTYRPTFSGQTLIITNFGGRGDVSETALFLDPVFVRAVVILSNSFTFLQPSMILKDFLVYNC